LNRALIRVDPICPKCGRVLYIPLEAWKLPNAAFQADCECGWTGLAWAIVTADQLIRLATRQ